MSEQAAQGAFQAVRAVVVYRYPVYRDLITRVLTKAEVNVAGALDVKELTRQGLLVLRPDVVVIYDPDANSLLRQVASSALLDPSGSEICRVVCVGSDNEMVVLSRLVMPNPSVEGLVDFVKGIACDAQRRLSLATESEVDLGSLPGQQTTGSGGS